jgi:2-amino-4-hydroxy-6-hydroxymethyldihydropteridine diphosphokinase
MSAQTALLALGANMEGPFGGPVKTFARAIHMLSAAGARVRVASPIYLTDPVGPGWQAPYHNAVVLASWSRGPIALLRLAKRIERACGRRQGAAWGPRTLDVDVIHHGARIVGWPVNGRCSNGLRLPHRHAATRPFVMVPLAKVAPSWRHPVTGAKASDIARGLRGRKGRVRGIAFESLPVGA